MDRVRTTSMVNVGSTDLSVFAKLARRENVALRALPVSSAEGLHPGHLDGLL
jgi:hypothetical protein